MTQHKLTIAPRYSSQVGRIATIVIIASFSNASLLTNGLFRDQVQILYLLFLLLGLSILVCIKLLTRDKKHFSLSITDLLIAFYLILGAFNALVIRELPPDPILLYKWTAILLTYVFSRVVANKQSIAEGLVVCGIIQAVLACLQTTGLMESNHRFFDITGALGNPGQLGGLLAICLVVSVGLLLNNRKKTVILFYIIASVVILTALVLTDSRAGWIATISGVCYIVYLQYPRIKKIISNRTVKFGLISISVISLCILYLYKKDSANGRLLIWRVTTDMISDAPILGHGLGSFGNKYMYYQASYFEATPNSRFVRVADNVSYPYNEFLHVWTEQGIIGLLILIAIIYSALFYANRGRLNAIFKSALVALILFSCFSYPASVLLLLLLFPIIIGSLESRNIFTVKMPRWGVGLSILLCVTLLCLTTKEYRLYKKLSKEFRSSNINAIMPYYTKLKNSPEFMDVFSLYILKDINSLRVNSVLTDASKISPSSELFCDLGDSHQQLNNLVLAQKCYKTAHYMVPSRILPLYKMFLMAKESQNTDRAKEIACQILEHKVKVTNTTTIKIKAEAKEYIRLTQYNQNRANPI